MPRENFNTVAKPQIIEHLETIGFRFDKNTDLYRKKYSVGASYLVWEVFILIEEVMDSSHNIPITIHHSNYAKTHSKNSYKIYFSGYSYDHKNETLATIKILNNIPFFIEHFSDHKSASYGGIFSYIASMSKPEINKLVFLGTLMDGFYTVEIPE